MILDPVAYTLRYTLPAAYALLPAPMASPEASALLIAIGLQESRFRHRQQAGGPARGFWQFEAAGCSGVMRHHATAGPLLDAVRLLGYEAPNDARVYMRRIEDNDPLAAVLARLLLWTLPDSLPGRDAPGYGWTQYLDAWRPGRPHAETWTENFRRAWAYVGQVDNNSSGSLHSPV